MCKPKVSTFEHYNSVLVDLKFAKDFLLMRNSTQTHTGVLEKTPQIWSFRLRTFFIYVACFGVKIVNRCAFPFGSQSQNMHYSNLEKMNWIMIIILFSQELLHLWDR